MPDPSDGAPAAGDDWWGSGLLWRSRKTGDRCVPASCVPIQSRYAILSQVSGFFRSLLDESTQFIGVVINPQVVDTQTKRRLIWPQSKESKESIFQTNHLLALLSSPAANALAGRLSSPDIETMGRQIKSGYNAIGMGLQHQLPNKIIDLGGRNHQAAMEAA